MRARWRVLVPSLCAALLGTTHAAILCVNPGGTDGCFSSIQAAINATAPGDRIGPLPGHRGRRVLDAIAADSRGLFSKTPAVAPR